MTFWDSVTFWLAHELTQIAISIGVFVLFIGGVILFIYIVDRPSKKK